MSNRKCDCYKSNCDDCSPLIDEVGDPRDDFEAWIAESYEIEGYSE